MALLLSAVGICGMLSHLISSRTREIGLKKAVGAWWSDIMCMIMRKLSG